MHKLFIATVVAASFAMFGQMSEAEAISCDYNNCGSQYEWDCPASWENDGDCDCGCQFADVQDCGGSNDGSRYCGVNVTHIEYYRDNLFLGLAYHRIGCATDGSTIQSGFDYDGFTYSRYCIAGNNWDDVPNSEWYDWKTVSSLSAADTSNTHANWTYDTPNNKDRSNTCSYNVTTDCNSDCWIGEFSNDLHGSRVAIASTCWGSPPNGPNWQ